jgi:hypothetical protein
VFDFLGLPAVESDDYRARNVGEYDGKDPEIRRFLEDFYRPHNAELSRLTGKTFTW